MVFPSRDGFFCGVAAMEVWRHELERDGLLSHECFQFSGSFIVQLLENGFEAAVGECCMQLGVGSN